MGEEATNVVKSNNSPPSLSTPNGYFINTIKEEERRWTRRVGENKLTRIDLSGGFFKDSIIREGQNYNHYNCVVLLLVCFWAADRLTSRFKRKHNRFTIKYTISIHPNRNKYLFPRKGRGFSFLYTFGGTHG
jgi:hypothetical protein